MNVLRAIWLLYTTHLVRTALSLRTFIVCVVAALPVLFTVLVVALSRIEEDAAPMLPPFWFSYVMVVVPILALVGSVSVFSQEVEDRTLSYLFTRPVPRFTVLVGRWLAAATVVGVIVGVSAALMLAGLERATGANPDYLMPADDVRRAWSVAVVGALVYSAIFAAAGTFLKHPIIVGLGYVFAFEVFVSNFPANTQLLTVQYWLKCWLAGAEPAHMGILSSLPLHELDPPDEALRMLGMILIGALALGSWVVSRKQYVLSS